MDVTSKAGLMVQPRHQQDLYDEPTSEIEFGELLGQLQFSAGSVQGLDTIVVPSNELTTGMEQYESADLSSDGGRQSEDFIAVQTEETHTSNDDDVEHGTNQRHPSITVPTENRSRPP